ncbi:type Z 30S ribosomal protein S14, partial [Dysosmobacter welbionis]
SRMATTQVSVSRRMARPKPCFNLICISGTTMPRRKEWRVGYCSRSFSFSASGIGNGSLGITR